MTSAAILHNSLDPFGYWANWASRIAGLGGNDIPDLAGYAFHTPYVLCGAGSLRFRLAFTGLEASSGALIVNVQRLPAASAEHAQTAETIRLSLAELARDGGGRTIEIAASRGDNYALFAQVDGTSDATAVGLTIDAEYADPSGALTERLHATRDAIFGRPARRGVRHLVSTAPATLADPVSQMCTLSQFEEPVYDQWVARLRLGRRHIHRKQWEFVYILQVLDRHGMLRDGRRGLGFGVGVEPLPALMASMGCHVVGTDLPVGDERAAAWSAEHQHGASLDSLKYSKICDEARFDERVTFRPVDMNDIPSDLTGFDFTWSSCAFEHLGSIPAGLRFVERSLDCLNPGGIAVHTTEFNLSSNDDTVTSGMTVIFRKRDIEALAARLSRHGHEVALLKYDAGNGYADDYVDVPPYTGDAQLKILLGRHITTSFGIVVRKGATRRGLLPSGLARLIGRRR